MASHSLVIINRPAHLLYYALFVKQQPSLVANSKVDYVVNKACLPILLRARDAGILGFEKVYPFDEPGQYSHSLLRRAKSLLQSASAYLSFKRLCAKVCFDAYSTLITFADDMPHFQHILSTYKQLNPTGTAILLDEGTALYRRSSPYELAIEAFAKRAIFKDYKSNMVVGGNPHVDLVFARFPELCNALRAQTISYRISVECANKWLRIFGLSISADDLERQLDGNVCFIGTPHAPSDGLVFLLECIEERHNVQVLVKPHPKEPTHWYEGRFTTLPGSLPAEILFALGSLKFVVGVYSSALIEAKLYGHQTFYISPRYLDRIDLPSDIYKMFQRLGIEEFRM